MKNIYIILFSFLITLTTNSQVKTTNYGSKWFLGFNTGATLTIAPAAIGGGSANLVLTVTSEAYTSDTTDLDINFFDSNRSSLSTFDLYFVLSDKSAGRLVYKLANAVVNEAAVDFDIDGIATINWSGFAGQITDFTASITAQASPPTASAAGEIWIDTDDSDSAGEAADSVADSDLTSDITDSAETGVSDLTGPSDELICSKVPVFLIVFGQVKQ